MSYLKDKQVLVTGGSGLTGSHLVKRLVEEGAKVTTTWHSKFDSSSLEAKYVYADLLDRRVCDSLCKGKEYVFHCAASVAGAAVMASTPLVHIAPNIIMNVNVLEAAYNAGVSKVLCFGSTTSYPNISKEVVEEDLFVGDPYDKYFAVGWMKRYTEVLCRMFSEKLLKRMSCIVLRPTNIFGPGDKFDPQKSHVLPALIRKVVSRQNPVEVWGDGTEVRDFIYVEDLVDACILAMERLDTYYPLNIGMGVTYTVNELLQTILKIEGCVDFKVIYDKSKPTMIPIRKVSVVRAFNTIGWKYKTSLEEGLRKTIDWYRSQ